MLAKYMNESYITTMEKLAPKELESLKHFYVEYPDDLPVGTLSHTHEDPDGIFTLKVEATHSADYESAVVLLEFDIHKGDSLPILPQPTQLNPESAFVDSIITAATRFYLDATEVDTSYSKLGDFGVAFTLDKRIWGEDEEDDEDFTEFVRMCADPMPVNSSSAIYAYLVRALRSEDVVSDGEFGFCTLVFSTGYPADYADSVPAYWSMDANISLFDE